MASPRPYLLLVRHAKAEDEHPAGDGARALTQVGRGEMRRHAARLAGRVRVRGIATSPLVRAVQTAEILAEAWGVDLVTVRLELAFDGPGPEAIEAMAAELGPGWALVGHNPSLAETLGRMTGASETPRLRKGAVAAFERTKHGWTLRWTEAPGKRGKRAERG